MRKNFAVHLLALMALPVAGLGEGFRFFEPVNPPRAVQTMAHRGASGQAPENTRPALQRCIEDGIEWAEVDLRLTQDGRHVLSHDATLEGKTSGNGPVQDYTLEELLKLDAGSWFARRYSGEHLLSFPECLRFAKGRLNLYLDCKAVNPELLVEEILLEGMENQVVVFGSVTNLLRVRQASQGRVAIMAKWFPSNDAIAGINSLHPDAVEINAEDITPAIARSFHEKGIKVQTKNLGSWDEPKFWDKALAAHVDWIQTGLPEELMAHTFWRTRPSRPPVRISLHRGANRYAPENTLPAFDKAIHMKADFVEFDVRTTSDGKYYLLHDGTLDGKTDGTGPIADAPSSRVATLSAGVKFGRQFAEVRLPTLDEFLKTVQGKVDLYFDAKAISPEALNVAIERYHLADRTVVYQSADYLLRLKVLNPRIRSLPPLGAPEQLDPLAAKLHPYAVDVRWNILSRELISRCHSLGILVFSDALGLHERLEDYQQAMDWGIDLIQTDHPLRVLRAIELRELKTTSAQK